MKKFTDFIDLSIVARFSIVLTTTKCRGGHLLEGGAYQISNILNGYY